ncbi:MAG: MSMEG_6728 family protein [Friedmanniella sp.]
MQTFVPYADFEASARALDAKRLGKQRVEVIQIVRALTVPGYAWSQHPAVLMWKGYEEALGRYGLTMCEVWLELGFGDTCAATITADLATFGITGIRSQAELAAADALPAWLFDPAVQESHRSALVRKDPGFYRRLFPDVRPDLDYVWPVRSAAVVAREERQRENARKRQARAEQKILDELAKAKRRRSAAARRGWQTRAANARKAAGGTGPS